jgi:hypothetical protein
LSEGGKRPAEKKRQGRGGESDAKCEVHGSLRFLKWGYFILLPEKGQGKGRSWICVVSCIRERRYRSLGVEYE